MRISLARQSGVALTISLFAAGFGPSSGAASLDPGIVVGASFQYGMGTGLYTYQVPGQDWGTRVCAAVFALGIFYSSTQDQATLFGAIYWNPAPEGSLVAWAGHVADCTPGGVYLVHDVTGYKPDLSNPLSLESIDYCTGTRAAGLNCTGRIQSNPGGGPVNLNGYNGPFWVEIGPSAGPGSTATFHHGGPYIVDGTFTSSA